MLWLVKQVVPSKGLGTLQQAKMATKEIKGGSYKLTERVFRCMTGEHHYEHELIKPRFARPDKRTCPNA